MADATKPAVIYLARKADGTRALERFAESYRNHPPGLAHELVLVFKGFHQQTDLERAKSTFSGIAYRGVELRDIGYDIGAYFECARRIPNRFLVFLNTHSEIASDDWLAILSRYGCDDSVGIAGAMGSYESIHDTVHTLRDVIWKCVGVGRHYDAQLAYYFDFLLRRYHPRWYRPTGAVVPPARDSHGYLRKLAILTARVFRYPWFALKGTRLIWPGAPRFDVEQFPHFPNPHVRSNGFMVRRDRWLQLSFAPSKKVDTNLFESGLHSFTARLRGIGLAAVVVGRDGRGYDVPDWPRSKTFRLGDQSNLIIQDNHTRAFEAMSVGARVAHSWMTWGDHHGPLPPDFPKLGFALRGGRGPEQAGAPN